MDVIGRTSLCCPGTHCRQGSWTRSGEDQPQWRRHRAQPPGRLLGAFIATKALYELQRIGGKYALVTMCIGGGQVLRRSSNASDPNAFVAAEPLLERGFAYDFLCRMSGSLPWAPIRARGAICIVVRYACVGHPQGQGGREYHLARFSLYAER